MSHTKEYDVIKIASNPSFSLSIGARKNATTKYAARVWDYEPTTQTLMQRTVEGVTGAREVLIQSFHPLIIGEDVCILTADGDDVVIGELVAFSLNEPGTVIPMSLAPSATSA